MSGLADKCCSCAASAWAPVDDQGEAAGTFGERVVVVRVRRDEYRASTEACGLCDCGETDGGLADPMRCRSRGGAWRARLGRAPRPAARTPRHQTRKRRSNGRGEMSRAGSHGRDHGLSCLHRWTRRGAIKCACPGLLQPRPVDMSVSGRNRGAVAAGSDKGIAQRGRHVRRLAGGAASPGDDFAAGVVEAFWGLQVNHGRLTDGRQREPAPAASRQTHATRSAERARACFFTSRRFSAVRLAPFVGEMPHWELS